jgi:plasmid stabilization system protein ParE
VGQNSSENLAFGEVIPVRLCSAAYRDIREVHEWYLGQAPELDRAFREELNQTLRRIREQPAAYPVMHKSIRRANLQRFPYGVFYVARDDDLLVLAVLHFARAPFHWKRRE